MLKAPVVLPDGKKTYSARGTPCLLYTSTDENIKSFDRVARKYGIDYSLKKEVGAGPPKYLAHRLVMSKDTEFDMYEVTVTQEDLSLIHI